MSKTVFNILLAILFITLFAQLTIEVPNGESTIPITGQTFAVLLVAYILGHKMGTITVIIYIILGVLGLPIFANGKAGLEVVQGSSGGFLIGFIVSAFIVGHLGEKEWKKSLSKSLLAMSIGTIVILFFGISRLAQLHGLSKALTYGFYPFWQGALIKIVLGAIILPLYYRLKTNLVHK